MTCRACDGSGYVAVELEPDPGAFHDPSGRGEVRCGLCNWRPGDAEPEEVEEMMSVAIDAEIDRAWGEHEQRQGA